MIRKLFALIILFLLLIVFGLTFLVTTHIGARIVVTLGSYVSPGQVSVEKVQGRLVNHIELSNIHYSQGPVTIEIKHSQLDWSILALMRGHLRINNWQLSGVDIHQAISGSSKASKKYYPDMPKLDSFQLPIALSIRHMVVEDVHWHTPTMAWCVSKVAGHLAFSPKGTIDLQLSLNKGRWLTPDVSPLLTVSKGHLNISGNIHSYHLGLQAHVHQHVRDITMTIEGQAQGDLRHIDIKQLHMHTLQGQIDIQGGIEWSPELSWTFRANAQGINASKQLPVQLSDVDFNLATFGSWSQSSTLASRLDVMRFTGDLNNHPLEGELDLSYHSSQLEVRQAHVKVGNNNFHAEGQIGEHYNIEWQIKAPDLAVVWPELEGRVYSEGHLQGSVQRPQLIGDAEGHNINYQKWHLHLGDVKAHIAWPHRTNLKIHLHQLTAPHGINIKDITLLGRGSAAVHQLKFNMTTPWGNTHMHINGHFANGHWRGLLTQWLIHSKQLGNWRLQHPSLFQLSPDYGMSPLKMHSEYGTFKVDGDWLTSSDWQLNAQLEHFNIQFLKKWMPSQIKHIQSDVSGHWHLKNRHNQLRGSLYLGVKQASVQAHQVDTSLNIHKSHISAQIAPDKGFQVQGKLEGYKPKWHSHFQAELPDFTGQSLLNEQNKIKAQVQGSIPHLDFLNGLLPDVDKLAGQLDYNLTAQGTWGQPQLQGQIKLINGQVTIVPLGLHLTNIGLNVQAHQQQFDLSGSLRSQDKTLQLNGHGDFKHLNNPRLVLSAQGQHLLVMNTPEYQIKASPDLILVLQPHKVSITGKVDVPKARIKPLDLSTVKTLPDTVTIKDKKKQDIPWQVYLKTKVVLGDDVLLRYQGLKAGLDGAVTVTHVPGQLMTGVGKLYVTQGYYEAYNRRVTINHGVLTFTGGDLTNPGLNILATRTIDVSNFGKALSESDSDIQVGFKVNGTVSNPKVTLYSSPSLSSQDILSYLVFGQPSTELSDSDSAMLTQAIGAVGLTGHSVLDNLKNDLGLTRFGVESKRFYNPQTETTQQTSAFVLGKQLSDRLSVRYSVGLLDPINVLQIEYELTKRLSLNSEASPYGSGIDLMYTFETD